jgi:putative aldouronate transport system permease protein
MLNLFRIIDTTKIVEGADFMKHITTIETGSIEKPAKKSTFIKERDIPIYLLLLPGLLLLFVFHYIPLNGIIIAFKNYSPFKGIIKSTWAGFDNFIYFLKDENFWKVMRNTVLINVLKLLFGMPVAIIFALCLNELWSLSYKKIVQTVSYLPYFISWVVAAGIVTSILSPSTGLVNVILKKAFNIEPIYFLAKREYFRLIIVLSDIWKQFGMQAVYYIAILASIDPELYEAANIDGAKKLRQIWHITLPSLKSIIIILLIIRVGNMVTIGFEQIFLLYNPLVYDVGDVISTYTYRLGIEQTQYSLTTAIGLTQSVVNFILVFSANKLSKKIAGWSMW